MDGVLAVGVGTVATLRATPVVDGQQSVTFPQVEGRKRVVLVDADGTPVADLENAVVAEVGFGLNQWEQWRFVLPVDDPKAHLVLDERLREAQVWRGDLLLSWGPMKRPTVDDTHLTVEGAGARWHFSRRHVGKASRENHLANPSFEQGTKLWHYAHGAYFLDFTALRGGDIRSYGPGMDGRLALEINMDLKPWATPGGALAGSTTHTVVSGDTLWDLAATYYGSGTQWHRIYDANQALIQSGAIAAGLWNPNDPGHWIFPGQVFTIPQVPSGQAQVAPADDAVRWGDVFAYQEFLVTAGARELTATLAGWVYVCSDLWDGWGQNRAGTMLETYRYDFRTNNFFTDHSLPNTWGGNRALYTDQLETVVSRLDEGHPMDQWVRHECSITVPAGQTRVIHARLCGVDGRVYWDKASLTYDTAFEGHGADQAVFVANLASHAQDPAYDKNDVNISSEAPNTGVRRTLVALHSEHGNIWDLMGQFTEYRDGLDIGMRYTPTDRVLTTHYPYKGVERRSLHLQLGRNIATFSWTFDGESAASSVVMLGTGDGSDREEASAIDTTGFANGLVLEQVQTVGPDTPVDLLQELADEALLLAINPEVLQVTTYPHSPTEPERNFIGRLWEGDIVPVTIRKGRVVDPDTGLVVAHQFEVDAQYRVVDLTILESDALRLTLNRWQPR